MLKKVTFLAISLFLACINFSTIAFAEEGSDESTLLTRDKAIELAEQFAQGVSNIEGIAADEARNIFDATGECLGALVSYTANNKSVGYVIIDKNAEGNIGAFSFGEDSIGPYEAATQSLGAAEKSTMQDGRLVQVNPLSYCVAFDNNDLGVTTEGIHLSLDDEGIRPPSPSEKAARVSWWGTFIDVKQLMIKINSEKVRSPFCALSQYYAMTKTKSYACAVSAMYVCAEAYGITSDAYLGTHYLHLWSLSGTTAYGNDPVTGATLGSTRGSKIRPAFTKFAADQGRNITYIYKSLPSFQEFKNTVDRGDVAIFNGMLTDGSEHSMAVEGWALLSVPGTNITYKTLLVANGYDIQGSYFNMHNSSIKSHTGVLFDA